MTKIEKQMIATVIVFVVGVIVIGNLAIDTGFEAYNKYVNITDSYKEKCLKKFKTIEYEVVNDELYCKSTNGLVKFTSK